MTAVSNDLQVTKEEVKNVLKKLSEMEDFKGKTVIHQVAIKKEMGALQSEMEAMKAKLSETCVFLDTISTEMEKLRTKKPFGGCGEDDASGNTNNNNNSSSNNDRCQGNSPWATNSP